MRLLLCLALLTAPLATAQFAPAPVAIGGEYQFETDLDGSGSFSRAVARARLSAPLFRSDDTIIGLSFGYQYESFDFSDVVAEPWDEIHRPRLGLLLKSDFGDDWSWMALPWVGANAESGADWGDAVTYGGIGGAWRQINDRLALGLGFGLSTELEDDLTVFPILFLDWKLTDCVTLSTVPPPGFRVGPGVTLRWDPRDDLAVSLIYQYQSDRYRLDEDSASSPDGIGQFRQSRIVLAATKTIARNWQFTGHLGVAFGGKLRLEDSGGDKLSDTDFDPTMTIGLEGALRF